MRSAAGLNEVDDAGLVDGDDAVNDVVEDGLGMVGLFSKGGFSSVCDR